MQVLAPTVARYFWLCNCSRCTRIRGRMIWSCTLHVEQLHQGHNCLSGSVFTASTCRKSPALQSETVCDAYQGWQQPRTCRGRRLKLTGVILLKLGNR